MFSPAKGNGRFVEMWPCLEHAISLNLSGLLALVAVESPGCPHSCLALVGHGFTHYSSSPLFINICAASLIVSLW